MEGELEIRAGRGSWWGWVAVGELEGELKRELGGGVFEIGAERGSWNYRGAGQGNWNSSWR